MNDFTDSAREGLEELLGQDADSFDQSDTEDALDDDGQDEDETDDVDELSADESSEDDGGEQSTDASGEPETDEPDWARKFKLTGDPSKLPGWVKEIASRVAPRDEPLTREQVAEIVRREAAARHEPEPEKEVELPPIDDSSEEAFAKSIDARARAIAEMEMEKRLKSIEEQNRLQRQQEAIREAKRIEQKVRDHEDWSEDVEATMMELARTKRHWAMALAEGEAGVMDLFEYAVELNRRESARSEQKKKAQTAAQRRTPRGRSRKATPSTSDEQPKTFHDAAMQGLEEFRNRRR